MRLARTLTPLALAGVFAAAPAARAADLVDTAAADPQFSTLVAAVKAAGLAETLKGEGPFTVFAPTNSAFNALGSGTVEALTMAENKDRLTGILTYHVVPAKVTAAEVKDVRFAPTVNGQKLPVAVVNGGVQVAGARVIRTDIQCDNGVIHVVDAVLLPTSKNLVQVAESAGQFTKLLAAAEAAGLAETLTGEGPFTVFAPTDSAFAKLPAGTVEDLLKPENKDKLAGILKAHVVEGLVYSDDALEAGEATTLGGQTVKVELRDGGVHVGDARVVTLDVPATNGVIHAVDAVLLPGDGGDETGDDGETGAVPVPAVPEGPEA